MVAGPKDLRSFTLVSASHIDGCSTKYSHGDYTGRYLGRNPAQAASKAFTQLCAVKKTKGQCALVLTIRETTQGVETKKEFTYKCRQVKLKEPIVLGNRIIERKNEVRAAKQNKTCKKSRKSSGPMKHRSTMKKSSKKSSA